MLYNIKVNIYNRNIHIVYSNKYHVVWCPKYRRAVLSNKVGYRLKDIIYQVAAETMSDIIEIMPDHVHLLCEVDPQFGIHQFIKLIKGRSSRQLRMEFPQIKKQGLGFVDAFIFFIYGWRRAAK